MGGGGHAFGALPAPAHPVLRCACGGQLHHQQPQSQGRPKRMQLHSAETFCHQYNAYRAYCVQRFAAVWLRSWLWCREKLENRTRMSRVRRWALRCIAIHLGAAILPRVCELCCSSTSTARRTSVDLPKRLSPQQYFGLPLCARATRRGLRRKRVLTPILGKKRWRANVGSLAAIHVAACRVSRLPRSLSRSGSCSAVANGSAGAASAWPPLIPTTPPGGSTDAPRPPTAIMLTM